MKCYKRKYHEIMYLVLESSRCQRLQDKKTVQTKAAMSRLNKALEKTFVNNGKGQLCHSISAVKTYVSSPTSSAILSRPSPLVRQIFISVSFYQ
jgi:hypothetical protein